MDPFELTMTLSEFGVDVPDKCKVCPRLGRLAATLSRAQENRNFLITLSDEEVLAANIRAQLTAQAREHFPQATTEQVAYAVDGGVANFLDSEGYTNALKSAGSLLEMEDATVTATLEDITSLLSLCPAEGCSPI